MFANLRHNKRLDRLTLRTQPKVNTQWNLYCLVHNIESWRIMAMGNEERQTGWLAYMKHIDR